MNFVNLQYFLVVVEEMNISKAAKRLSLTQQSLSHHIQRLEEELGTPLFIRKPGLELTYAGRRFEKAARRLVNIEHEVYSEIEDIKKMKYSEFRIGISSSRSSVVLPKICPQFYSAYPDAKLTIIEKNSLELEMLLEQGRIDIMIGYSPRPREHTGTLNIQIADKVAVIPQKMFINVFGDEWKEQYQVFREGINFAPFKNCPFALMSREKLSRLYIDEYFKKIGIHPKVVIESENVHTLLGLANAGVCITVCEEMYCRTLFDGLNIDDAKCLLFPIKDDLLEDRFSVAYHKEHYMSQSIYYFISLLYQEFSEEKLSVDDIRKIIEAVDAERS